MISPGRRPGPATESRPREEEPARQEQIDSKNPGSRGLTSASCDVAEAATARHETTLPNSFERPPLLKCRMRRPTTPAHGRPSYAAQTDRARRLRRPSSGTRSAATFVRRARRGRAGTRLHGVQLRPRRDVDRHHTIATFATECSFIVPDHMQHRRTWPRPRARRLASTTDSGSHSAPIQRSARTRCSGAARIRAEAVEAYYTGRDAQAQVDERVYATAGTITVTSATAPSSTARSTSIPRQKSHHGPRAKRASACAAARPKIARRSAALGTQTSDQSLSRSIIPVEIR